jgi:tetraacyldisaccharide 4'-kinase
MSRTFSPRGLLWPLVPAYRLALLLRELRLRARLEPIRRLRFPVVSIGNLSTGGSGKTPLTIALAQALSRHGFDVDVLSRGYGRTASASPVRVNPDGTAEEFGDEPLLIARETGVQVYLARQRYDAGMFAEAASAGQLNRQPIVHLLDDGFQHRQLHRDIDLLLLDLQDWHDGLLPAGNLREPRSAARRASVIAIPADEAELEAKLRTWGWQGPIWRLKRTMEVPAVDGPVAVFCGIARPEQFFAGLEAAGLRIALRKAFADHHRYTAAELDRLRIAAVAAAATAVITTEKDLVRMEELSEIFPEYLSIRAARLCIEIEHEDEALEWLMSQLNPAPAPPPL